MSLEPRCILSSKYFMTRVYSKAKGCIAAVKLAADRAYAFPTKNEKKKKGIKYCP
jgi:hypothetical protein